MFLLIDNQNTKNTILENVHLKINLGKYDFYYRDREISNVYIDENYFIYHMGIPSFSENDFKLVKREFDKFKDKKDFRWQKGSYLIIFYEKGTQSFWLFRDSWGGVPVYFNNDIPAISDSFTLLISLTNKLYLNQKVICEYLSSSYIVGTETLLKNISALRQFYSLNLTDTRIIIFKTGAFPSLLESIDPNEVLEETEYLISQSIDGLVKSIPNSRKLFVSLSGGTDSSLLVSKMIEKYNSNDFVCGVVEYDNWPKSDLKYFSKVLESYSIAGHVEYIDNASYAKNLEKLLTISKYIYHTFSPSFQGLISSISNIFNSTSYHINGTGPDEALFGFEKSNYDKLIEYNRIPKNKWIDLLLTNLDNFYTNPHTIESIIQEDFNADIYENRALIANEIIDSCKSFTEFQRRYSMLTVTDHHIRMLHHISLVNGYETLFPYCTEELFILFFSIPFNKLNSSSINKIFLKRILSKYFNETFVYRPKIGFHAPSRAYFKDTDGMRKLIERIDFQKFHGIFDINKLMQEINLRISCNEAPMDYLLWTITNLGLFLDLLS
ncbi:MAG: asparagine synthase-related protein [Candidatus Xenobiia bacterium LiM19]